MFSMVFSQQQFDNFSKKKTNIGFLSSGENYAFGNKDGNFVRVSGLLLDLSKVDIPFYRVNINVKVAKKADRFVIANATLDSGCDQDRLDIFLDKIDGASSEKAKKNRLSLDLLKKSIKLENSSQNDRDETRLSTLINSTPEFWPAYVRYGYLKGSTKILTSAIKLRPDYSRSYVFRATVTGLQIPDVNIADLQKAIKLEPDNVRAWCLLANLRNAPEESIRDLEQAVKLNSCDLYAIANKAHFNESAGNFKEALSDWNSLIGKESSAYNAYFQRGNLKYKMGDNSGALNDLSSAIEKFKNEYNDYYLIQMLYKRGLIYRALGETDKAIADFDKVSSMDNRSDAKLAKAETLFDAGREKEAQRAWLESSESTWGHTLVGVPIGGIFDFELQNVSKKNQKRYYEAVKKPLKSAEGYQKRSLARLGIGDKFGALLDINDAIKLDPRNSSLFETRSQIRSAKMDTSGALEDLETALKLDPQNPILFFERSEYRRNEHDMQGARADAKLAKVLCRKKYSLKEIQEDHRLHHVYYGFPAASKEYEHSANLCLPNLPSQHFEMF
ncbi:MAG: tetratricopeptide repeat protein [Candidatus Melainabacteria bacterium]|nr:tetratricopeptide repeat protein [Candidatus Melainabacteria bacterium]